MYFVVANFGMKLLKISKPNLQLYFTILSNMDFTQISTENLVKQMKLLLEDTKKRIVSSLDVSTSGEVKRENVQLAKKNLKDIEKMLIVLTTVRDDFSSSQRACTLETQRLFNDFRDQVSDTAMKVFGNDDWEIHIIFRRGLRPPSHVHGIFSC